MSLVVVHDHSSRHVDDRTRDDDDDGGRIRCPVTGTPCRGILAYLCEDYGCARKGGLSPDPDDSV